MIDEIISPMEQLATDLSVALEQEICVEDECIILQGDSPKDLVILQIGANDGNLYFSAPIIDVDQSIPAEGRWSILLELNSDTKNYPHGRIAGNAASNTIDWIERLDPSLSGFQIVELIQDRGVLIAKIRQAMEIKEII